MPRSRAKAGNARSMHATTGIFFLQCMSEKVREQGAQFIGMYIGIQKAPQSGKAKIGEKKKK